MSRAGNATKHCPFCLNQDFLLQLIGLLSCHHCAACYACSYGNIVWAFGQAYMCRSSDPEANAISQLPQLTAVVNIICNVLRSPTQRASSKLEHLQGIQLNPLDAAQMLHGLAGMGYNADEQPLIQQLADEARSTQFKGFDQQAMSNIVWAVSKTGHKDKPFMDAVNSAVAAGCFRSPGNVKIAQSWSNTLYGMATLAYYYPETVEAITKVLMVPGREYIMSRLKAQHCSNIAWSFGQLGILPSGPTGQALLAALSSRFLDRAHALPDTIVVQNLTNLLWALLVLGKVRDNLPAAQKLLQMVAGMNASGACLGTEGATQLLQVCCTLVCLHACMSSLLTYMLNT